MEVDKVKMIPVDEDLGEMLNWAIRYALGRRTYAVSDTCRFVGKLVNDLDGKTLGCALRDIEEYSGDIEDYGMDCDVAEWITLRNKIRAAMEAKGIEEWPTLRKGLPDVLC